MATVRNFVVISEAFKTATEWRICRKGGVIKFFPRPEKLWVTLRFRFYGGKKRL